MKCKKTIFYFILLFSVFPTLLVASENGNPVASFFVSEQGEEMLSKDMNLKIAVILFITYDSCYSGESRNFNGLFPLLSSNFLAKRFPKVKSESDYVTEMLNREDVYHQVYSSINRVEYIQQNRVKINLELESQCR